MTERELRTLTRLCNGATNHEIASELSVSSSTVRNGTVAIYRKLGLVSRSSPAASDTPG